jgi:geranylgeranyl pyrophosphate synthase
MTITATAYGGARALIADDLLRLESKLEDVLSAQRDYLRGDDLRFYRGGKQLRPLLLLLAAHACATDESSALDERAIAAAASIEIIHVGSLIHDDIVDKAPLRRGLPTISASRGYETAMLLGDLQFIEAASVFASFVDSEADLDLMRTFLDTGRRLCRGQLDELLSDRSTTIDALVQRYYRTVDRKTAQLTSFACEAGARLAGAGPSTIGTMRRFGHLFGRAFQVMDDVLDVVRSSAEAGKERMIDVRRGRLSLPILFTLASLERSHPLWRIVNGEAVTEDDAGIAVRAVEQMDGWVRAWSEARAVMERAIANLRLLTATAHRHALEHLAAQVVDQGFLEEGVDADDRTAA